MGFTLSSTSTATCLFMLILVILPQSALGLNCWVGSSSESASDYPPADTVCPEGFFCQLTKVERLDVYYQSCVSRLTCDRNIDDLENNPDTSLYSEVSCCDNDDRCNSYPGQSESEDDGDSAGMALDINQGLSFSIFIVCFSLFSMWETHANC